MRRALPDALARDMEIEIHETDESREFKRIAAADGPKAALAWRRARSGSPGD